ncbi:MAG: ABC transporter ATP-binding protein [Candidatus Omnitrophota bacterium]
MNKTKGKFNAIWFFLKQYEKIYGSLLVVTIGYTVLESVSIFMFLPLFGSLLGQEQPAGGGLSFLEKVIQFLPFENRFLSVFLLTITVLITKELLAMAKLFLSGYGVGKFVCDAKEAVFNKYVDSDYQFFLENKQGKLSYNLLNATGISGNCLQFLTDMATAILMTITLGALLLSISLPVTASLLILGIGFNVLTHMLARKVSYNVGKERTLVSIQANVTANEFVDGIKHIKVFDAFEPWVRSFVTAVRRFKALVIKDYIWGGVPERVMQALPVGILVVVALSIRFNAVSLEFLAKNYLKIGVYIYTFYRLMPYLTSFGKLRMQIMGVLPDVEILYEALRQNTNHIPDGSLEIENFNKEIKFEGVNFSYKGKKDILRDVNFSIERGKVTAIVGASGMGKSTLVNLIVRLFDPDGGRITIDGADLREIKYSSLIRLIGLVSQDTFIFNATIKENIIFGLKNVSNERLFEAGKLANANEFITGFPDGYETTVGDKGFKLSGGQRQRIAIARAILRNPQILVLDEATSSLDYHSEVVVQQAINAASRNRTVVVIAHRLSTVINADKILVVDQGRLVEEGRHHDLLKKAGVYKFLYESQDRLVSIEKERK